VGSWRVKAHRYFKKFVILLDIVTIIHKLPRVIESRIFERLIVAIPSPGLITLAELKAKSFKIILRQSSFLMKAKINNKSPPNGGGMTVSFDSTPGLTFIVYSRRDERS
jgi:hypothetical protein